MFKWQESGEGEYLSIESELLESSFGTISSGFGGKSFDLKSWNLLDNNIHSLEQVHGVRIVHEGERVAGSKTPLRGDGWNIQRDKVRGSDLLFFIKTADCLPVIFLSEERIVLAHAGWRGLKDGILKSALQCFSDDEAPLTEIWVGPAADPDRYEVGEEFAQYFSKETLIPKAQGKFLFNLYKGAELSIREGGYKGSIHLSPVNTISDQRFFSHRSEPESRGRNYSFVAFQG